MVNRPRGQSSAEFMIILAGLVVLGMIYQAFFVNKDRGVLRAQDNVMKKIAEDR